jgi:hypothetical protein
MNTLTDIRQEVLQEINKLSEGETPELQFPDGFQPAKSVPSGGAIKKHLTIVHV